MNKTSFLGSQDHPTWYLIDAKGHKLGRLATEISNILRGKRKACFHPSQAIQDHVVIINAKYIEVSGRKAEQKVYYRHSGKPGHLKIEKFENLKQRLPHKILENAVRRMLPQGSLGRQVFRNLKIYSGTQHPHQAQKPKNIQL
uniref:Large ribosomal subunit protein uL13c n=1 Tax=Hommersandiophycus borowitzkae TaxID=268573 RepID=A0A1G4NUD8_9FLOR|nr:Ribosomal protein L13 [Hommersandiophycus borowitzkae]SCW22224.1 Ribosomal protein L13 [Hommersandiophycus borowitzkae]